MGSQTHIELGTGIGVVVIIGYITIIKMIVLKALTGKSWRNVSQPNFSLHNQVKCE